MSPIRSILPHATVPIDLRSPSPDPLRAAQALVVVRAAGALTMVVHGAARSMAGGVPGFGAFLGTVGLPAGTAIAWGLTLVEMAGGLALALGYGVRLLALWFALQLAAGIVLVHGAEGWFVVGLGRNGMEYSVVLIALFVATAWAARPSARWRR